MAGLLQYMCTCGHLWPQLRCNYLSHCESLTLYFSLLFCVFVTRKLFTVIGVVNPFAMTSLGANGPQGGTVNSNPFAAQQPPRPSLNQMTTTNQMGGFNSQPPMLNPMMPTMTPQNSGFPVAQQPMMYQQPTQPAAYNMNNPFLWSAVSFFYFLLVEYSTVMNTSFNKHGF